MPIYEYYCEKCNCTFEHLKLSETEDNPACPTCCDNKVRKLMSAGNIRSEGIPAGTGGFGSSGCRPSGG